MINKAILIGRIGKIDSRMTQSGKELTQISLATSRKWKDSNGESQELTTWHNISCFGSLADIAMKYANVGDLIYIEGEIQNRKVESNGEAKWMYSVTASHLELLSSKKQNKESEEEFYI